MGDIIELKYIGNNQYIYCPLYVNLVPNFCSLEERDKIIDDIAHQMVDKLKHFKLVSYDYQIVPDIEYEWLLRLLFKLVIEEKENTNVNTRTKRNKKTSKKNNACNRAARQAVRRITNQEENK